MDKIRHFKLHNSGAFVAHMIVEWAGYDSKGDEKRGKYEPKGYHDICAAAERTIDLKDNTGIPNGAIVTLHASVVAGKGKTADESFTYDENCGNMAEYDISGTTLINKLKLKRYN